MTTSNKGPKIIDLSLVYAAGIDPKTGLPLKADNACDCTYKEDIKRQLRVRDEQDAVNTFIWTGLPCDLSSQELERLLYYKGQLCFFYMKETEEFYFMPYALDGGIDFYGRFKRIHPIPAYEGVDKEGKAQAAMQRQILSMKKLDVLYGIQLSEITWDDYTSKCVILRDYTPQGNPSTIVSRQILNDSILDMEANMLPYMNTALKNSTGIEGVRVNNPDESANVYQANFTIEDAALTGKQYVPIIGTSGLEFQDLTTGNVLNAEEFLMAMQSIDNFRLTTHGLSSGGLYQKSERMLVDEQNMNAAISNQVLQDRLSWRQNFCDICNTFFGTNIDCQIAEQVLGVDRDLDGTAAEDNHNQTGMDTNSDDNGGNENNE